MNTSKEYFTTKLYPLQDGILSIVKESGTPFYLTGGTALSRGRYEHRFSEDLDLFVDNDSSYPTHVEDGLVDAQLLVTHTFGLDEAHETMSGIGNGTLPAIKAVMLPNG